MSTTGGERFDPDQFTVPAGFPELLKDLSREVLRAQPKDIPQFACGFFQKKIAERRSGQGNNALRYGGIAAKRGLPGAIASTVAGGDFSASREHHHTPPAAATATPGDHSGPRASQAASRSSHPRDSAPSSRLSATAATAAAGELEHSGNDGQAEPALDAAPDDYEVHDDDDDDDILEDDDDEEEAGPLPPALPPAALNRGRRTSVSAESMAPTAAGDEPAHPRVDIPKTDEQRARIRDAVAGNFLFRSCDDDQRADVVAAMAEKPVAAGDVVIEQGAVGDYFYVVESGALDVLVLRQGAEQPEKVAEVGPGGSFGELALMYNAPRAATVVARSACVLWALDRVTFRRILMENTARKRRMYESFLEELPLLAALQPYERAKVADALESMAFADGDVVIKQGDVGENFYLIESGEAAVEAADDEGVVHELSSLGKGAYFG
ncbi:hypothetical protein HK405_013828, partial [Cladochytrium tenue]